MIAQRFRPVGWVAGVAVAATALYMISLKVASERGRLESIDRQISRTHRDIRQLQTELGTRASLRQLERWNLEALALSAPQAGQYLPGEQALGSADQGALGDHPAAPPPVMTAVGPEVNPGAKPAEPAQPAVLAMQVPAKPDPAPKAQDHAAKPTILKRLETPAKLAARDKPAQKLKPEPQRVAMLDRATIKALSRSAVAETGGKPRK